MKWLSLKISYIKHLCLLFVLGFICNFKSIFRVIIVMYRLFVRNRFRCNLNSSIKVFESWHRVPNQSLCHQRYRSYYHRNNSHIKQTPFQWPWSLISGFLGIKDQIQNLRDKIRNRRSGSDVVEFIADVVVRVAPAVVQIKVKDTTKPVKNDVLLSGTGFIVSSDGVIVTNAHVVRTRSNTKVDVILLDGRVFDAKIQDRDEIVDLACLKVNAKGLPCVTLGDSSRLKAGEWVVALGNPFGLTHTVTYGVVSATNRSSKELQLYGKHIGYIQTDAGINEGNSGGPLVNLNGEVIGVNVMKLLPGISFAIPIDRTKEFLAASWKIPDKSNSRVGVSMVALNEAILLELRNRGYKIPSKLKFGMLVRKVFPGTPAS